MKRNKKEKVDKIKLRHEESEEEEESEGEEESDDEYHDLDPDHRLLLDSVYPLLKSRNSGVRDFSRTLIIHRWCLQLRHCIITLRLLKNLTSPPEHWSVWSGVAARSNMWSWQILQLLLHPIR